MGKCSHCGVVGHTYLKCPQLTPEQIEEIKDHAIARAEWVDLSARLDIVEQETNQTLGKVRSKLDTFSKDVKQIAVVPERELNEMFDIVHLLHGYLAPENSGNR